MVYLLHFDKKYHHAQHYIGFCDGKDNLESRMECHRNGRGAKLIKAITQAGIKFQIARIWENGDRNFERKLKNRKKAKCLYPICKEKESGI